MESWDRFYINECTARARKSKDPSTKVGAIIVRPDKRELSWGYNGFPRGVKDNWERYANRDFKYPAVVHAELNAILNAETRPAGCTIYTSFHPCARCAAAIVQSGIECVVCAETEIEMIPERWRDDVKIAKIILAEGGVRLRKPHD